MRKLASIRRVSHTQPISNADLIECAYIDGWSVVIKKGEFQPGDLCVYLEVDSWVPHKLAPFLTSEGQEPQEYKGIKGAKLRTLKLKNQLSQGLLLSLHQCFPKVLPACLEEGTDVTYLLNIQKWERELPPELIGKAKGAFPSLVHKTDLDRIQNLSNNLPNLQESLWYMTEKLHGMSCSMLLDHEDEFHVCSKDLDLLPDESNSYWRAAYMYGVEEALRHTYSNTLSTKEIRGIAIQGEIVGKGVLKNYLSIPFDWYVFSMYDVHKGTYVHPSDVEFICKELGLKHVPILERDYSIKGLSMYDLICMADGYSLLNPQVRREGLVFRSTSNPNQSFKVVSNKWLLKMNE